MKKAGILTLNDNNNYGNRLQNFACQQTLEELGFEAETIINKTIDKENRNFRYYIKIFSIKKFFEYLRRIIENKILNETKARKEIISKRRKNFEIFNQNISFSDYIIKEYKNLNDLEKRYNYFVVGSDQVWNPYSPLIKEVNFLMFSPKEKNISYAASFGVNEIPKDIEGIYIEGLKKFKAISVREDKGQKIVKDLTNEESEVVLDPTMMLTKEQWMKIEKKPPQLKNKKYILNYFLGKISKQRKTEIEKIAKENNCEIINILDKKDRFYVSGPSEFLCLERNAFLVCTDSFHSCVFAILFNTPFIVFGREDQSANMNSRIETLLSKFKLENRYYKGKINQELLKADYTEAYKILEEERKKTLDFLKDALNIEEN